MIEPFRSLNRLAKWRVFFAGWQLGTRPKGDPESDAVSDSREILLLLRVENNALLQLLVAKGVFTEAEWGRQLELEAKHMNRSLEERYPGFSASDEGLIMSMPEAAETVKRMNFKP
jgi:hypothetical protein